MAQANQAHLRLMETTDIHVAVFPYDYYADAPNDTMGLARTASLIDAIRAEATNSMLIDNGDLIQGNPMGDYIAYERGLKDGDVHPIIAAMNTLGYECSTLGNHEFNYGLDFLDKALAGANFPFVCANLVSGTELAADPRDDKLYLKPYRDPRQEDHRRRRRRADDQDRLHRLRAAADHDLGRATTSTARSTTRDIVETAKAYVPEMKEEGADIIIALSHSGIDGQQGDMMENASLFARRRRGHRRRSSPATSIWCSPTPRISRASRAPTSTRAR